MYYCDHCGEKEETQDTFIGISKLPVDIDSACKGESAILCPKCVSEKLTFAISFTRTFRQWVEDEIKIDSDTNFVFGCTKDHALCDDQMIPNDIAYNLQFANRAKIVDGHLFDIADIIGYAEDVSRVTDQVKMWETFKEIIKKADAKGNVWWKEEWRLGGDKPFYLNEITEQLVKAGFIVIGGNNVR